MLASSQTARKAVARHARWRGLSSAEGPSTSSERVQVSRKRIDSVASRRGPATRSIFIRPWDGIGSTAEAFAIIRGIEKKYGRIREFKFLRDHEIPSKYQSVFWADFRDTASFDRVPQNGEVIQIPAPPADPNRVGGLGIDDLQGLLEPQDRREDDDSMEWQNVMERVMQSNEEKEKKTRILDVRVERGISDSEYAARAEEVELSRNKRLAIGHAFLDWGGFARLEPLTTSPYTSAAESIPINQQRMRAALTKWSTILRRPDPSVPKADIEQNATEVASTSGSGSPAHLHPSQHPPQEHASPSLDPSSWEWEPLPTQNETATGDVSAELLSTTANRNQSDSPPLTRRQRLLNRLAQESHREEYVTTPAEVKHKTRGIQSAEETTNLVEEGDVQSALTEDRLEAKPPVKRRKTKDSRGRRLNSDAVPASMKERLWSFIGGDKWL